MGGEGQAGGSLQLGGLIDQHGECLVADFEQYTNYHLSDLYKPGSGLTPTLALVIIKHLPLGSATVADMRGGPDFRGWDMDRYIAANTLDALRLNNYLIIMANRGRGKKPEVPQPMWRPSKAVKKPSENNPFRIHLERVKRRKAKANGG